MKSVTCLDATWCRGERGMWLILLLAVLVHLTLLVIDAVLLSGTMQSATPWAAATACSLLVLLSPGRELWVWMLTLGRQNSPACLVINRFINTVFTLPCIKLWLQCISPCQSITHAAPLPTVVSPACLLTSHRALRSGNYASHLPACCPTLLCHRYWH